MAKVIIGGQMLCLLLTLLVTPITYSIFDHWGAGRFFGARRSRKTLATHAAEPVTAAPDLVGR